MSLLALGSALVPAFPPARGQWLSRDPLADHSGGTAPDSHRLPRSAVTFAPMLAHPPPVAKPTWHGFAPVVSHGGQTLLQLVRRYY